MWGGPDTLYVSLRNSSDAFGSKVYEQVYECDHVSAFDLKWQAPSGLQVRTGLCDVGPTLNIRSFKRQNKVIQRNSRFGTVGIQYVETGRKVSR